MEFLFSSEIFATFIILTFLEIVLGIDNIIFIAIAVQNLPEKFKKKARYFGISLSLIIRSLMLFVISWVISLTEPLFSIFGIDFSYKSIILFIGGIFLIVKSSIEIWNDIQYERNHSKTKEINLKSNIYSAILQIAVIDFVFSFDSIVTAIGITNIISIIIIAIVISMIVMVVLAGKLSDFITKYPRLKTIAMSFILLIGFVLIFDAFSIYIEKKYLYFALFFTIFIEIINIATKNDKSFLK